MFIEAALHDVGREQNVGSALDEAHHPVVNLVGWQFAMETDNAKIRRHCLHPRQHRIQILDAWTDQEALPVTPLLAQCYAGLMQADAYAGFSKLYEASRKAGRRLPVSAPKAHRKKTCP
jgi:hypothetical protein